MKIDLDKLLKTSAALYNTVTRGTNRKRGICDIYIDGYPAEGQTKLRECAVPDFDQRLAALKEFQQKVPATPVEPAVPQRDLEADLKRDLDHAAGLARIEQYATEQGLERTPQNAEKIQEWLNKNVKGYMSVVGVDLAIQWLGPRSKNVLTWKPKEAPAPPPPEPEPQEVLQTLADGSQQLPLSATPDKYASVAQLKDWLARTREATGKYVRPRGSWGTSL